MEERTLSKEQKIQTIIVVSCVIFAVLLVASLIMGLVNLAGASSKKKSLEKQLTILNTQIEENEKNINYYQTQEYIDRIAREYLNMQGEGEITFIGK